MNLKMGSVKSVSGTVLSGRCNFFKNQEEFSDWLEEHTEVSELWVGYFRKNTGTTSLTWSESVDVALCFGWIDGI